MFDRKSKQKTLSVTQINAIPLQYFTEFGVDNSTIGSIPQLNDLC